MTPYVVIGVNDAQQTTRVAFFASEDDARGGASEMKEKEMAATFYIGELKRIEND
jgi:hypothetical protein